LSDSLTPERAVEHAAAREARHDERTAGPVGVGPAQHDRAGWLDGEGVGDPSDGNCRETAAAGTERRIEPAARG